MIINIRSGLLIAAVFLFVGCSQRSLDRSSKPSATLAPSPDVALIIRQTDSPAHGDSREPDLNPTPDGRIIMSWVEKIGDQRYALRTALRDQKAWTEAATVAQGENWFVNWADFPSVIALPDGSLAAHWLVKSGKGTYAYNVNIARTKNGGKAWTTPVVPHLDNTATEHGFVSLLPLADGRVGAIWLDGRNLKDIKGGDDHAGLAASMTLRYAAIDENGKLSDESELDERVCECCQTAAAVTSEGAIAVYRDRSQTEVRDISAVRQEGQSSWGVPRLVHEDNWEISGCPVNGPSIAAAGRSVVVAWFTAANDTPTINLTFSGDAGATFGAPIKVDEGEAVGRVDTILLSDGSALVCWMSGTTEQGAIKVRRVHPDGTLGPSSVIAETSIARSSGFPRMARLGDEVYFVWTEFGKPSRVRMATAKL